MIPLDRVARWLAAALLLALVFLCGYVAGDSENYALREALVRCDADRQYEAFQSVRYREAFFSLAMGDVRDVKRQGEIILSRLESVR